MLCTLPRLKFLNIFFFKRPTLSVDFSQDINLKFFCVNYFVLYVCMCYVLLTLNSPRKKIRQILSTPRSTSTKPLCIYPRVLYSVLLLQICNPWFSLRSASLPMDHIPSTLILPSHSS